MLLEVTMIAKTTVVFGNTWVVNAIIIFGILSMILVANALVARWPNLPLRLVFVGLLIACAGVALFDPSAFAGLSTPSKAVLVAAGSTLPMLFSGIVFIRSFAAVQDKTHALGANLFGSLVGGLLQTLTYATGVGFLLVLVGGLYLTAVLIAPKTARKGMFQLPGDQPER
jgi:hypothetical protein